MVVALGLLLATYAGIVAGVAFLIAYRPNFGWYWAIVVVAVGVTVVARIRNGGLSVLSSVGATIVAPDRGAGLHEMVERLAGLADIPVPELALVESDAANALAVGLTRRRSVVVVTRGLVAELEPKEVEAVLAHETAHLAHRDAAVMTAVAGPRLLGEVLVGGSTEGAGLIWTLVWPLGLLPLGVGTALTLTVSRYREYAADRGAVLLTGAPEELMSALRKLAAGATEIPHDDLRSVNAFCIVSTAARRHFTVLSDHPPLEKRLARLEQMARDLGKVEA
jgi:heat shock protein HtpX